MSHFFRLRAPLPQGRVRTSHNRIAFNFKLTLDTDKDTVMTMTRFFASNLPYLEIDRRFSAEEWCRYQSYAAEL